jgi:hypothetical protein
MISGMTDGFAVELCRELRTREAPLAKEKLMAA